eukprot:TRINITY_DN55220_c0_g1_i1.p1 TRINITY_DN55220_c0_g1~~TRINITY_DN55220_c0_g1_i1.p1  ORF type:complete len:370 (+),score=100.32 TRINITY_DN55220_c0_g1_i1:87-1112(+)
MSLAGEDLYAVLGAPRSAYQADLRRAFRLWALRFHPLKNGGGQEVQGRFTKICNAFEILGDEDRKDKYDRYGYDSLSWDGPLFFSAPDQVFRRFFSTYGGGDIVQSFLQKKNGAAWEGWASAWSDLERAMPKLADNVGMSCGVSFSPQGPVDPSAGRAAQRTSGTTTYGAESASPWVATPAPQWAATPAPSSRAVYSSTAAFEEDNDSLSSTAKGRWMTEYRRRSGSRGGAGDDLGSTVSSRNSSFNSSMGYSVGRSLGGGMQFDMGTPCKDAALAEYRARKQRESVSAASNDRPPAPPPRVREGFNSSFTSSGSGGMGFGQSMRQQWLQTFRRKKSGPAA